MGVVRDASLRKGLQVVCPQCAAEFRQLEVLANMSGRKDHYREKDAMETFKNIFKGF